MRIKDKIIVNKIVMQVFGAVIIMSILGGAWIWIFDPHAKIILAAWTVWLIGYFLRVIQEG